MQHGLDSYLSGFPLCDVPQGHYGISVNSHGKGSSCGAMYGQNLGDWLQARRVTGITQNLQVQDDVLGLVLRDSLREKLLDGLSEKGSGSSVTLVNRPTDIIV